MKKYDRNHKLLGLGIIFSSLLLLSVSIVKVVLAAAPQRTLKVGLYDNPPKEYLNQIGQAKGLFPDVLNYIAKQENWQITYILGNFDEDLLSLEKGQIDILVDIDSSSPIRKGRFDFPKEHVINSWGIIFVGRNSNVKSFTDLNGKKIAVLQSNVYITGPEGILEYLDKFDVTAQIVQVPRQADAFDLLNKGQVDAALVDRIFALGNQANYPNIKSTDLFFYPTTLTFAFQKDNPENPYLIGKIDYWLTRLKNGEGGVYQQILKNNGLTGLTTTKEVIPTWINILGLIVLGILVWLVLHVYFLRRTRAEIVKRLGESEEYNRSLVQATDRSGIGMIVLQNVNGKEAMVISANETASRISGYSKDELLKMSLKDVLPLTVLGQIMERYKARQEGHEVSHYYETEFLNKKGNIVPVMVSPAIIKLNGQDSTVVYFTDISELKKAREDLQKSEKRFRSIFEKSPSGIALLSRDLKFIAVNQKLCKMAGLTEKEFKNLDIRDITPPEFLKRNEEGARALLGGTVNEYRAEEYYKHKDGRLTWASINVNKVKDARGNFLYFLATFDDITDRKKAEDTLFQSEERFRNIFEKSPLGIATLGPDMAFTGANPTFCRMMGINEKDITKLKVSDVTPPEYIERDKKAGRDLVEGKIDEFKTEEHYVTKNGKTKWFSITVRVVKDSEGNFRNFITMFDDITHRKEDEETLKKNISLLDSVVNSTADGLLVIDARGRVAEYNEEFQRLWKIPEKIIRTKNDKELLSYVIGELKDQKAFLKKVDYLYKHPGDESLDTIYFKDGKIFERYSRPQKMDGKIVGRVWSFRDVTKREKALQNLSKEYATEKSIFESMEEGVMVVGMDAKVLMINRKGEQLLGWKSGKMIGKDYRSFTLIDEMGKPVPINKRPLMRTLKTGEPNMTNELSLLINGEKIDLGLITSPIIVDGKMIGGMAVFRDIRRDKEVEKAKSEFVSIASHQLRTPLGISKWYLEALKADNLVKKDPNAAARYIDVIEEDNERLIKLINDLLNVSRIEQSRIPDNPVITNISGITKGVLDQLGGIAAKKNVVIKLTDKTAGKIKIKIDQERFKEVVECLVSNSIKYSDPNSTVTIVLKPDRDQILFSVTDRGIGINRSDRSKIFSKFFRSAEASRMDSEGSGLGLFVAKSYIEGWGGNIGFDSTPGKITRFYFNLPLTKLT